VNRRLVMPLAVVIGIVFFAATKTKGEVSTFKSYATLNTTSELVISSCSSRPKFVDKLGISENASFTTSDRFDKGLLLLYSQNGQQKEYADPTYSSAGSLGEIEVDEQGNTYVHPIPYINLLDNPLTERTTIWRVSTDSGKMEKWVTLPADSSVSSDLQNPYGIMSLYYDCSSKALYANTLNGSDKLGQHGKIYKIDIKSKKISQIYSGQDLFGIVGASMGKQKYLLAGDIRSNRLLALDLDSSKMSLLSSYTPKGLYIDSRVKKITQDKQTKDIVITLLPFDYSLAASGEDRREKINLFRDSASGSYKQR
jgi:hypothetical protein